MRKIFKQWPQLIVAYCLVVRVLSVILSPAFSLEKEGNQSSNGFFCHHSFELNQVCIYHERVYPDNVVSTFWFVRSFSSQHHTNFIANIATENESQVRTKECKIRFCICRINLNVLRSSRHFNCDTFFAVLVFFLNKSVHGFSKIRNGRVITRLEIKNF